MKQPEIVKGDKLYELIVELVKEHRPEQILEIGASNGLGSTQAFIQGIREAGLERSFIQCVEANPDRQKEFFTNINVVDDPCALWTGTSIPVEEYMTENDIDDFFSHPVSGYKMNILRHFTLDTVKGWRKDELENINTQPVLDKILDTLKIDMALIDGSAFTGMAEYQRLRQHGVDVIILDDTYDIKNWDVMVDILGRGEYECIKKNNEYRNGYAAFKRVKTG